MVVSIALMVIIRKPGNSKMKRNDFGFLIQLIFQIFGSNISQTLLKLSSLNNDQIHYANIGLMVVSAILAFVLPFELFLFSYAVLGPLHYLTEIGWLHKKNYYTKGKYDFLFLSVLCVLVFYFSFIKPAKTDSQIPNIILYGVLLSLIFVFIKDNLYRVVLAVLAIIGLAMAKTGYSYFVWVGVFLPTIIHVLFFTWAFMLYGVIKNK